MTASLEQPREISERLRKITVWPGLFITLYVLMLLFQISRMQDAARWVQHTDEVIETTLSLQKIALDAETGMRGYVLTGNDAFAAPYVNALQVLDEQARELEVLVSDNASQLAAAKEIHSLISEWSERSKIPYAAAQASEDALTFMRTGELKARMDRVRAKIDTFIQTEQSLRADRNRQTQFTTRVTMTVAIVFAILLAFGYVVLGRRQIRAVTDSFAKKIEDLAAAETELRKANETLEIRVAERTAELQETNQELEAFTYSVSHDLRAPLRAVEGFASALEAERDADRDQRNHYITRIRSGARKMGQIIDDLLMLSRISRSAIRRQPIDLSAIASDVLKELGDADPKRNVVAIVEPGIVQVGDRDFATLLIRNLLANAWKYTSPRSEARIEFGLAPGGDRNAVFVRDNGVGFNPRYIDKIFLPFERLHSDEEFEGTGVGLAIAKRVVDRHGGKIWAESKVGEGSVFYFSLEEK